jgi:hypothetical protein
MMQKGISKEDKANELYLMCRCTRDCVKVKRHELPVEIDKRRQLMFGCFCSIHQAGTLFALISRISLFLRSMDSESL